jgi:hypothetical protein
VVASTEASETLKAKKATKRSADGLRAMGFADLVDHLGSLTLNVMRVALRGEHHFTLHILNQHNGSGPPSACSVSILRVASRQYADRHFAKSDQELAFDSSDNIGPGSQWNVRHPASQCAPKFAGGRLFFARSSGSPPSCGQCRHHQG